MEGNGPSSSSLYGNNPTSSGSNRMMASNAAATRSPLSVNVVPIRPEPRRLYHEIVSGGDKGILRRKNDSSSSSSSSPQQLKDNNTLLLQQAANYASLAIKHQVQPRSNTNSSGVNSGTKSSYKADAVDEVPLSRLNRALGGGILFRNLSNRKKDDTPPLMSLHAPMDRDDVDGFDAPRLSMSSAESSGGSEVKTPESVYYPAGFLDVKEGVLQKDEEEQTSGRNLTEQVNEQRRFATRVNLPIQHHRHQSAAANTSTSYPLEITFPPEDSLTSPTRPTQRGQGLMEANQQEWRVFVDDNVKEDESDPTAAYIEETEESKSSSGMMMQSRASTIRAKRPDSLLRLASTRTDDTARPSPPSSSSIPSTAGPTPAATADNAFGKGRDPMDDAVVTRSGHGLLSSSLQDYTDDLAKQITQALNMDSSIPHSEEDQNGNDAHDINNPREHITSPDSWRSLLPDNDPYFVPSETLSSSTSSRAASFAGPTKTQHRLSFQEFVSSEASMGGLGNGQVIAASASDKDNRRLSTDSLQSSFSLAGPTAASIYASSNASGSLYDLDGTFNNGGSRAAFAPLQYQYNHSSKSLTSPLLQDTMDRDIFRSNSIDEMKEDRMSKSVSAQQAAYRRHASFSAFDSNASSSPAHPVSPASIIHPDHRDRSRVYNGGLYNSALAGAASSPERQAFNSMPLKYSSLSRVVSPSSPASSCAMGNEGDRESWPSSRTSLQGWQSEVANSALSRNLVQVLDPYSVNKELEQSTFKSDLGSVESVPSLLAMSTSTTESDAPGLPADHRLLTTTTLTTLASTTTTLISTPTTPSDAGSASVHSTFQSSTPAQLSSLMEQQHTQQKPAYDIGPLSPITLPFLESRVASSNTELNVETHPTHYTLKTMLPGFDLSGITLSIKHHRELVIVADSWDENSGGHFERRVTFGIDADLRATTAKFDGTLLKISVPRVN